MIDLKNCHQYSLLCKFKTIYVSSQILIEKKLILSASRMPRRIDCRCAVGAFRTHGLNVTSFDAKPYPCWRDGVGGIWWVKQVYVGNCVQTGVINRAIGHSYRKNNHNYPSRLMGNRIFANVRTDCVCSLLIVSVQIFSVNYF